MGGEVGVPPERAFIEPRLPQELEHAIFVLAAHSDRDKTLPALLQVARRVREWLQPIIYDTVILLSRGFYETSKCPLHHPPPFPSGSQTLYVRNLLVVDEYSDCASSEPEWEVLLPQCANLQDLGIWFSYGPQLLPLLTSITRSPLRTVRPHGLLRLSTFITGLFPDGRVDFNHEIFKDLTHLEVLDDPAHAFGEWVERNNYGCMPKLRCLGIADGRLTSPSLTRVFQRCLKECKALEVLIFLSVADVAGEREAELLMTTREIMGPAGEIQEVPEDRAIAYKWDSKRDSTWTEDWYSSAVRGGTARGEDFWTRAEVIVQRRRRRRQLEKLSWDSVIDSDADISLADWLIGMGIY